MFLRFSLWQNFPIAVQSREKWAATMQRYAILATSLSLFLVSSGSPSRGGDVAVYVFDINQPSLPTPLYSVHVSVSVVMALSVVFHSINSLASYPLSHSVLSVLFSALLVLSTIYLFMKVSLSPDIILCG